MLVAAAVRVLSKEGDGGLQTRDAVIRVTAVKEECESHSGTDKDR